MTTIYFNYEGRTEETSEVDPEDDWSRASTHTTWEMPNFAYLDKDKAGFCAENETVEATINPGDSIYLVSVIYSTGDSFGHDSASHCEVIGIYQNEELAVKASKLIQEKYNKKDKGYESESYSVYVPVFDGSTARKQYCGSWDGYFESLDRIEVTELLVI